MSERLNTTDHASASVIRGRNINDGMEVHGHFEIECLDKDGKLKWKTRSENLVPNAAKNKLLDTFLANGTPPTSLYMSFITAGSATSASTYASPTITEVTSGVIANRLAMTWVAAANGSKSATTTTFSIIGSAVLTGNYIVFGGSAASAVGDTAGGGTMWSAANFESGALSVSNGDTVNVVYQVSC